MLIEGFEIKKYEIQEQVYSLSNFRVVRQIHVLKDDVKNLTFPILEQPPFGFSGMPFRPPRLEFSFALLLGASLGFLINISFN